MDESLHLITRPSFQGSGERIDPSHGYPQNPSSGMSVQTSPTSKYTFGDFHQSAEYSHHANDERDELSLSPDKETSSTTPNELSMDHPTWFQNIRMERAMPIEEIERSSRLVIDLVESRFSLAKATDYVYTHSGTDKPENAAIYNMTPSEVEQYTHYQKHGVPVKLNKDQDQLVSPKGGRQFPRMIEALDRMFEVEGHTKENVAYFYHHYPEHVPLLKALYKVSNAERNARSNTNIEIDAFQEYQTCRKVLGNAQYVYQHTSPEGRLVAQSVRRLQTILERHMAECAGDQLRSRKPPPQPSDSRRFRARPKRLSSSRQYPDPTSRTFVFQNFQQVSDPSEQLSTGLQKMSVDSNPVDARTIYPTPWISRKTSPDLPSSSGSSSSGLLAHSQRSAESISSISDAQPQYIDRRYSGFVRNYMGIKSAGEQVDHLQSGPVEVVVPKKCLQSRFFPSGNRNL